eukprot:TRINITY_DN1539_c0_g1_i1.p2 TRINITY_DN1539_c0_g1~~TRINITY_DN1539_c0_g1_i1.p2  ORF type:complete len:143 (-),score=4.73 TRINITY_DN1539_c0_g1_i1:1199-1627(-)
MYLAIAFNKVRVSSTANTSGEFSENILRTPSRSQDVIAVASATTHPFAGTAWSLNSMVCKCGDCNKLLNGYSPVVCTAIRIRLNFGQFNFSNASASILVLTAQSRSKSVKLGNWENAVNNLPRDVESESPDESNSANEVAKQ